MDLETLDGFLCGVVVGPVAILPSEFLPVIWGGELSDEDAFASEAQAQDILSLIIRFMNQVASAFEDGGVYLPELEDRSDGSRTGHRWASGFMRAVDLRRPLWSGLIQDENEGGAVLPIALLAGEVDPAWLSNLSRPMSRTSTCSTCWPVRREFRPTFWRDGVSFRRTRIRVLLRFDARVRRSGAMRLVLVGRGGSSSNAAGRRGLCTDQFRVGCRLWIGVDPTNGGVKFAAKSGNSSRGSSALPPGLRCAPGLLAYS
jgi:yecA family protein